jgi:hypothetical protein
MSEFPVLKLRASEAATPFINELSLDGVDLLTMSVTTIEIRCHPNRLITASFTVECVPDIELPAGVTVFVMPKSPYGIEA